jgi:hypothetical protein
VNLPGRHATNRDESGTITLWLLGCCTMLLVLGGLGIDLGRGFSERRALSSAADAAALAGAGAIDEGAYRRSGQLVLVPALAEARARADLQRQLDAHALRSVEVHADGNHVEVVVHGDVELSILRLLDQGALAVRVHATAVPRRSA